MYSKYLPSLEGEVMRNSNELEEMEVFCIINSATGSVNKGETVGKGKQDEATLVKQGSPINPDSHEHPEAIVLTWWQPMSICCLFIRFFDHLFFLFLFFLLLKK